MAILCKLINATSWWVLNKDSDVQAMATALLNQWVINDADTWNLAVTAWQVASGKCFIEVTRTNTSPNEKWLLYVWNQQDEAKTLWSNKFIYIEIPQNNINDNTLNTNPTWSWIANIVVWSAWPASNYIPLATTDWSWNITDVRTFIKLKTWIIDKLTGNTWKIFYSDWAWKIQEITIWSSTQVLTSNGTSSAPTFQSISIDITALTEKTTIQEDDLFVMYSASNTANRKIKATNALKSTKEIFVAWEDITAWNALYIHTDWKAYKTDASNSSKINFIWFATNTVSSWWNVIVDTSWVSNTQTWLTIWSDYYLWWDIGASSNITVDSWTGSNFDIWYSTDEFAVWQTFTTTDNLYISKVEVYLWKTWSPTDNLIMEIRSNTTWSVIATSNTVISWTTLTTTPTKQEFLFNFSIPAWTTYTIYISRTGGLSPTNFYGIYDTSSNIYAWWSAYRYNSNWTPAAIAVDLRFIITANTLIFWWKISSIDYIPLWLPIVKIWQAISATAIKIEENNDDLNWTLWTTATTWSVVLWNAVWYVTIKINWVDRKIPYYS
jgi:hypothetical protein